MKYSLFIGRWQPWHDGHRWLIDQRLNEGKKVWLAIRDVPTDENNPYTPKQVLDNLTNELLDLVQEGKIMISIIPDIESVNYGRGVGYEIIEHVPPTEIKEMKANYKRQIAKAITFRVLGTLDTILASWFITGSFEIGAMIGGIEIVTKIILYFFHERVWDKYIKYGLD